MASDRYPGRGFSDLQLSRAIRDHQPVAVAMYWEAMNRSRKPPYVQQFRLHDRAKEIY